MADASFDIVSEIDLAELDNAVNQAQRELSTRFDFRGTGARVDRSGEGAAVLTAETEDRVKAALEVLKEKLIKRGISLKAMEASDPRQSGKESKIDVSFQQGIAQDKAKKIGKIIRDEGPKGVKPQIQGEKLRVSGKKRDDLQEVIQLLKGKDLDVALQFVNYR
ncbi:YajQ family cyclic di-GMP-binding protein [Glycomyces xiaoerkulensis]|uniref:YajQ family cyclic di-GMP-binding protein n=1 Tax=Glycomyces xiaoerkulensis TaxID=2038139 RepID=UPI000C256640|nr:YajQ family cyclic di-GMP-binding protein [Glycomyces xiaoerkulensis]